MTFILRSNRENRPPKKRAVTAFYACLCALTVTACQPGPPPTPTLPPELDITITSAVPSATVSVTPIPSLTASMTNLPATETPTATPTARHTEVREQVTAVQSPTAVPGPPRIPPLTLIPTLLAPVVQPSLVGVDVDGRMIANVPASGINPLPLPAVRSLDQIPAQPVNTGFDEEAMEQGAVEVVVPDGWTAWWRTGPIDCGIYQRLDTTGLCPALEEPNLSYRRPEFTVIPGSGRWLDPPRVVGDGQAARFFCTYGICEAGYLQQVRVTPGAVYTLSAMVHAWCTQNTADVYHSHTGTRDEQLNCELALGLDPSGGINPLSPDVVWTAVYAYDVFAEVVTPPVRATGQVMTLYLRGRSLWAVRHNDFHFDRVSFGRP